ncbi:MAG: sialidase family protein, partial [Chloroflexi bacterium]|nr:sialidase family protein [Chloroflexota bacterium]
ISIHQSVTDPSWTFVGTGPGHGIQLKSGRLLIPCWFDVTPTCGEVQSSCCIYSDDHGETWKRGEPLTRNASDECDVVELEDGTVYLNARSRGQKHRAYAFSTDGGQSWSTVQYDPDQPEPSCDGALIRLSDSRRSDKNRVLVACPTNPDTRAHIRVRMSYDECRTWPIASEPLAHLGGYSDLAVTGDREILCLYESWPSYKEYGENRTNLVLAKFNVEWLSGGKDKIAALDKTPSTRNDARPTVVKAPVARSDLPCRIGVYLAADNHPQNLQLSRMMADWAGHGINTACMRADIYLNLAPQGFHTLAKQWGIDLVVQPTLGPGPEHRRRMQELIQRVDSYQDSDAVTAWYAVDEFEGVYDSDRPADTEKVWRELVSAIKDLDPKRNVIVNHDARTGSWGGRFAQLGEDESWCSVFWANHHAADFLRKTMATHRAAYSDDCPALTLAYGAQSTNKAGSATDYEQHGISGVTLEQLKSVSTREDIADYVLTAHNLGAGGAAFFCYDGYYDFQYYTLADVWAAWLPAPGETSR